jgi:hypothetical protein
MKAIFDYATNAACPQRPSWEITSVNYKWAQSVFKDRNLHRIHNAKKQLNMCQCRTVFGRMIAFLFGQRQIAQTQIEEQLCTIN